MKNNPLIALALAFFILMAWYKVLVMPAEKGNNIEEMKAKAESYAESGAPEVAIRLYQDVLKTKDTIEDRKVMLNYFKSCIEEGSIEIGQSDLKKFVSETMELYEQENFSYEMAMEFWSGQKNYAKCAEIMEKAILNNTVSEVVQALYDEVKYEYRVNNNRFGQVMNYSGGLYPVLGGRGWAFCNSKLSPLFEGEFDTVTICNDGYVVSRNGERIKIYNTSGKVQSAFEANGYEIAGAMGSGMIPLVKDGKYIYVSMRGEIVSKEFDMAGVYSSNMAAVLEDEKWRIITSSGDEVLNALDSVILDEDNRCISGGRMIVVKSGSYIMYDAEGTEICKLDVDDVKLFGNGNYAAASKNGKWGFIDKEGKWVMDPVYEGARSYRNGFAAVCKDGKWGYIDEVGNVVVDCLFEGVKDFTGQKVTLVLEGDYWNSLELLCK